MKRTQNVLKIHAGRHAGCHVGRHGGCQGFTLMEVLVSSALTVVILTMLFTVLVGAMEAWQTGTNRLQGNADARMALDTIAQDLQSMVVRQTTYDQEWLYASEEQVADAPAGTTSTWLTFFSPSLEREPGQQGDIVALSYRVGYQDPLADANNPAYRIFGLYKHMIDTRNTFQFALGRTDVRAGFWQDGAMDSNLGVTAENPFAAGTRNSLDRRSLLIPNVVEFSVKWNVTSGGTTAALAPAIDQVQLRNAFYAGSGSPGTMYPGAVIESADISMTILTEEGARRVQTLARGPGLNADSLNRVIREHGRVYTKRVKVEY